MTIQLAGKNFELTEAIKEHVEMALRSRFDAYEGLIVKAEVVCEAYHEPRGGQPSARVKLELELPGPDIIVEKEGSDLYELVNIVAGVAYEQVEKRKEKGEI
jgi:ribosomal subunit interface protein